MPRMQAAAAAVPYVALSCSNAGLYQKIGAKHSYDHAHFRFVRFRQFNYINSSKTIRIPCVFIMYRVFAKTRF